MLPGVPHVFDFVHIKSFRDVPHLLLVLFLISGIAVGTYLALRPQTFVNKAAENTGVEVKFAPDVLQIQTGRIYEAKIAINPKQQRVTGISLNIGYDPSSVTILEIINDGFLPVTLKSEDKFDGNLNIVYGSTIETSSNQPGMLSTIKFKTNQPQGSEMFIKPGSQVTISSKEGNVLNNYSVLSLEAASAGVSTGQDDIRYPDSLLLEKAFRRDSEPFVREVREALEPKPSTSPDRIEPEVSEAYLKQLGKEIFIDPIVALNDVLQEKAEEIIGTGNR